MVSKRYFIELAYDGTKYGGFQVQDNTNTIQAEVEKALFTLYRQTFHLTGSSRTDAGVHALQNYFHVDAAIVIEQKHLYNLNSILPNDIAIKSIRESAPDAHCRFQASHRTYHYFIYQVKDPFIKSTAWFYPYPLDLDLLNQAAALIATHHDFTSFSKRNTQAKTKICSIMESYWQVKGNQLMYTVKANRFLRGMVRGLVGTMLQVGRGKISLADMRIIIDAKDCSLAHFDTPAHGLFLAEVGL
ncbi:MAG: tRNA pseudouridine(38-40) synthase TruA [Chitinophagaceae bacterium]